MCVCLCACVLFPHPLPIRGCQSAVRPKVSEKGNAILNKRRRRKEPSSGDHGFGPSSRRAHRWNQIGSVCVCVVKTASAGRISRWNCSVAQKDQNVAEEKLVLKGKKERKKKGIFTGERSSVCGSWCVSVYFGAHCPGAPTAGSKD